MAEETRRITKEELTALLERAFQSGFQGYLDLKESISAKLAEEFFEKTKDQQPIPMDMAGGTYPFLNAPAASSGFSGQLSLTASADLPVRTIVVSR